MDDHNLMESPYDGEPDAYHKSEVKVTSREFVYWLQGFFELTSTLTPLEGLDSNQVQKIKNHLDLVFEHEIDPSYGDKKKQKVLNHIHNRPSPKMRC